MRQTFDRWTAALVARPWLMIGTIVVLTLVAATGYTNPDDFRRLVLRSKPDKTGTDESRRKADARPPNVDPVELTRADAIVVVQSPKIFSQAGATALRQVVAQLDAQPYVESILWLDRVPMLNIFGLPEPILPRSLASPQRFEAARKKALANPIVLGQLLSADCQTTLLMVRFNWYYVRSDDECTINLRKLAEEVAAQHPAAELSFQVTGRVPMFVTAVRSHESNQFRYQLIGYGMIALMATVLFRGIAAVLVVALAPCLGVFWTLGIIRYFDFQQNPFNDVVLPVLLSLIGLTDGVHLMVQTRYLRASGMSGRDAAREGVREVGLACLLTAITTGIGFASLYFAHHEVVREFAICCVMGVGLTFVAVITVIPLACATWLGRWIHLGHEHSPIDRQLGRICLLVDWVLARPRVIAIGGVLCTFALAAVAFRLRPDERNADALPGQSEARAALRHIDRAFGGLESAEVSIAWKEGVAVDSPEVLEVISTVERYLRKEPLIGHPISIATLLNALPGEGSASERASMIDLLPPPLKRAFYTPEYRTAKVNFRVQDLGIAKYAPIFERIESRLLALSEQHPNFVLSLSGNAVWRWRNLYRIVMDLATSLGSASIEIFVVLVITFRSFRLGLISIIPNIFPLAITGSILAAAGQSLELVTVCAFTVCLGIAVDDTIHFITRFEQERKRTSNIDEAIRNSFTGVGTALIMTTVILVAGFSTVTLSDSRDHRIFAIMGILTLSTALICDLMILPALLSFSDRLFPFPKTPPNQPENSHGAD